jgi:predicted phosphodiesterase
MPRRHLAIALVLATIATLGVGIVLAIRQDPAKFEVGLIGDIPNNAEEQRKTGVLFEQMDHEQLAFVIHVGDIKSGDSPCTDEVFFSEKDRFDNSANPLIYVPGDNDWTDCSRTGYDPVERLERLREIFFVGDESLGEKTILLNRQSTDYPENVRWNYGGVTFVGLNVPGTNNNREQAPDEYAARNEANLEWMREGFSSAEDDGSSAVMIVMQANPGFDRSPERRTGYNDLLGALEEETIAFGKPVVLVHGDTHTYRVDKPMISSASGEVVENFTRVETFGSPDVNWVRAAVDTSTPEVFAFEPEIIEENTVEGTTP